MKYARKCDYCECGMDEGFVTPHGYFCSGSCKENAYDGLGLNENYAFNEPYGGLSEEEVLEKVIVFDNEGETFDQYTIFLPDGAVYGMSHNAKGFNQYVGNSDTVKMGSHLGKMLDVIPSDIKYAILGRMLEDDDVEDEDVYWTQWDESFFEDGFYYQVEFHHNGEFYMLCVENEDGEADHWASITTMGTTFDVHYCEEYNEVCVYLDGNYSNCIYQQKIKEDETSN